MAWDGFDSNTQEALKGVSAEPRESYYQASCLSRRFGTVLIVFSSILIITGFVMGFAIEKPLGYAFVLGGILGIGVAAIWFSYRS